MPDLKVIFEDKGLSKYEIQEIYNVIDINLDGAIDRDEYDKFYNLFLSKFISCNPNNNFELKLTEAKNCFMKESWMKRIQKSYNDNNATIKPIDQIFDIMDINKNQNINLSEYVFARKVSFVFRKCT